MHDVAVGGALAAASGHSWSLNVWEAFASSYPLDQPDGSKVFNDVVIPASFFRSNSSGSGSSTPLTPGTLIVAYGDPGTGQNVGDNFRRAAAQFGEGLRGLYDTILYFHITRAKTIRHSAFL